MTKEAVIFPKGCLSGAAKTALRRAGYSVIEATEPEKVRLFYPRSFNAASDKAKMLTLDHALQQKDGEYISKSTLREWYIHYLKEQKAY